MYYIRQQFYKAAIQMNWSMVSYTILQPWLHTLLSEYH